MKLQVFVEAVPPGSLTCDDCPYVEWNIITEYKDDSKYKIYRVPVRDIDQATCTLFNEVIFSRDLDVPTFYEKLNRLDTCINAEV